MRVGIGETLEPDEAQSIFNPFPMGVKQSLCFQAKRDVAPNSPPRIKGGILKDDNTRRIGPFDRLAVCEQRAGAWKIEPGDKPQQRGFSAPARSQKGDEFPAADAEANAVQHVQRLAMQLEVMAQIAD